MFSQGVKFRVNGGSFFTSSRNININDVITTSGAEADGLICQSERTTTQAALGYGDWYLHPEDQTTTESDKIQPSGDRGWKRTRTTTSDNNKQVILRRQPAAETALEGKFTCEITGDSTPIRSLYVLYPSEFPTQAHTYLTFSPLPIDCSWLTKQFVFILTFQDFYTCVTEQN